MENIKIEQKDGYVVIKCETPTHIDRIAFPTSKDIAQLRDACNEFLEVQEECPNCGEKAGTYSLGRVCCACHEEL